MRGCPKAAEGRLRRGMHGSGARWLDELWRIAIIYLTQTRGKNTMRECGSGSSAVLAVLSTSADS